MPLYPQAGSPTTSTFDAINAHIKTKAGCLISDLFLDTMTIELYKLPIGIDRKSFQNMVGLINLFLIIMGCLNAIFMRGTLYCFCHKTTRLVAERLSLDSKFYDMAFQSRFGYEKWLQPYIDDMIPKAADDELGIFRLFQGFGDCLETMEEINIQYRELFLEQGGEKFEYIPCLNDGDDHIKMINQSLIII